MTGHDAAGAAEVRVQHPTLAAFVLNELRQRIILGQLAPGSRLVVDELAQELSASRIPVRESLRQLEAEGLVCSTPRRGVRVTNVYKQDIDDAYGLLEHAELLAAERAVANVTPALLSRMSALADEMLRIYDDAKLSSIDMLVVHRSFHFAVFEAASDGLLMRHLKMLWNVCERFVAGAMLADMQSRETVEHHRQHIVFLERRDLEGLSEVIREHLESSRIRSHCWLEQSSQEMAQKPAN